MGRGRLCRSKVPVAFEVEAARPGRGRRPGPSDSEDAVHVALPMEQAGHAMQAEGAGLELVLAAGDAEGGLPLVLREDARMWNYLET